MTIINTQYLEKKENDWYVRRNKRRMELKKISQYKVTHSNEASFLATLRAMSKH